MNLAAAVIMVIMIVSVLLLMYTSLNIQGKIMGSSEYKYSNSANKYETEKRVSKYMSDSYGISETDIHNFKIIYNHTYDIVHEDYNNFVNCLSEYNNDNQNSCILRNRNVFKSYYTKHYCFKNRHKPWNKNVYNNWTLNYKVLISESIDTDNIDNNNNNKVYYDLIFGTPNAPHLLSSRLIIRKMYGNYKEINNLSMKHLFFMGRPENEILKESIPLKYLIIENEIYKDIVMFDIINHYRYLTVNMLLFYNFILKYYNFKYFVRIDDDVSLKINLLPNLIYNRYNSCEIIGYSRYEPKGPFQILKYSIVSLMNSSSFYVRPFSDAEDLYHGTVYRYHNKSHCHLVGLVEYTHFYSRMKVKDLNSIAVHNIPNCVMIYY